MSTHRQKRRIAARNSTAAPHPSTSTSVFELDDIIPGAPQAPINTFVDRISQDGRRKYRDIVPVPPPSPVKKARIGPGPQDSAHSGPADPVLPYMWGLLDAGADRYELSSELEGVERSGPSPPKSTKRAKYSDPVLYAWKERSRMAYLQEFHRLEGCGSADPALCPTCRDPSRQPRFRCQECMGGTLYCAECCVSQHSENPLHVIHAWNGVHFVKTSLKALGLCVQFGHPPGEACLSPEMGHRDFVVVHVNGIHEVRASFCRCRAPQVVGAPDIQLLRGGWFPATEERPRTCMSMQALRTFHYLSLVAKTTLYDYYSALEKLTGNVGCKPPDRYQVVLRIVREYVHLKMLERGGVAYLPDGVASVEPGSLAIRCPCCPRPGVNLPSNYASAQDSFIYTLFLALDACFRLKRGLVSSELKDPGLGTGMAYVVENEAYRQYLLTVTDQKEISTCSGLAALDYANTKFSRGYSTTGVGMGVCARHEFIQPNGVGDLQKGERFANIDYIFASILRHHDYHLIKVVSYDIVCQWWRDLLERLKSLPELVRCSLILAMLVFVIPKMHIHAHILACQIVYSLNYVPGSGRTDGEGIERPWANIGGIATSTRVMGPGARHDALDAHWSHWNWQKLVRLGDTLRRRLDVAKAQHALQTEAFVDFSTQQMEHVPAWKKMVDDFEAETAKPNPQPNPYETIVVGLSEAEVRLQFQKEEEDAARSGQRLQHKVTPSTFMTECLALEEEQRRVRLQAELKKSNTAAQQIDLSGLRTKLNRRIHRLRKLQRTYMPASIVADEERDAPPDELPEDEPLFLPSSLTSAGLELGCAPGLLGMEEAMRDAQCRTALSRLRNQLHIKSPAHIVKSSR